MIILLMGPPGCGKGTQAKLIKENFRFKHCSTGDLLRQEISKKTKLGKEIESLLLEGKFVNDQIVFTMIKQFLEENFSSGLILDGFPRTKSQLIMLDDYLTAHKQSISLVIKFDLSPDLLCERVAGRLTCHDCGNIFNKKGASSVSLCPSCGSGNVLVRTDDNCDTVKFRLQKYEEETKELYHVYEARSILTSIDGDQSIEAVYKQIESKIKNLSGWNKN